MTREIPERQFCDRDVLLQLRNYRWRISPWFPLSRSERRAITRRASVPIVSKKTGYATTRQGNPDGFSGENSGTLPGGRAVVRECPPGSNAVPELRSGDASGQQACAERTGRIAARQNWPSRSGTFSDLAVCLNPGRARLVPSRHAGIAARFLRLRWSFALAERAGRRYSDSAR